LDIEWIRQQVRAGNYEFSGHADDERQAERIPIAEVEEALLAGEVLEDYPNDPRGPRCLKGTWGIRFMLFADKPVP
jgi:hypothetical protein